MGVTDRLNKVGKIGKTIIEVTGDKSEAETIKKTVETLESELNQIKNMLNTLRQEIGDVLDAWERFMTLHNIVISWVAEKKTFLQQPLNVETLSEAKHKLNDYSVRRWPKANFPQTLSPEA